MDAQDKRLMIYDYLCRTCGSETEAVNRISERRTNAPVCCDERMDIIIKTAPMGFVDREIHYWCPATNKPITSRRPRNEMMKREGLVDANDIVNHKTIKARVKEHEKRKEIVEKHRLPNHLKSQFEALPGVRE